MEAVLLIVAALIIVLVLMQSGESDGFSGAFTGTNDLSLFAVAKDRGPEKVMVITTYLLAIAFFALVIYITIFA
jgi:preprotein translocase subunit SecG